MNAIASLANTLTGSTLTSAKKAPTLAQCKAEMTKQIAATQKGIANTLQAAVLLGEAAAHAKALMAHGQWGDWLKENFEAKGTWVRVCMRAAEAWHLLEKRPALERDAVLDKFNTVEKLADTLGVLDQGENPLETAPVKRTRAPNKPKRDGAGTSDDPIDVESREVPDTGKGANDAARMIKDLDKRAKALDHREAGLNQREARLVTREQAVALKEAALKGTTPRKVPLAAKVAAATKEPAPVASDIEGLKAAKLAADAKANAKAAKSAGALVKKTPAEPAPGAAKARKPKAKGVPASTPKIAPETAEAIRDAATRAVKSDADKAMDQPHHGHGPQVNGADSAPEVF